MCPSPQLTAVQTLDGILGASAVGRLMLGEMSNWQEFLEPGAIELESLPRRILKAGSKDVRGRVSKEVKKSCERNFKNLTEAKLDLLYEDVKAFRGLEMPVKAFEEKDGKVCRKVLKDAPSHSTVEAYFNGLAWDFAQDTGPFNSGILWFIHRLTLPSWEHTA